MTKRESGGDSHVSRVEEDYLKAFVDLLQTGSDDRVGTGRISSVVGASMSNVTNMLKVLSAKGWVDYKPYGGACLTRAYASNSPGNQVFLKNDTIPTRENASPFQNSAKNAGKSAVF